MITSLKTNKKGIRSSRTQNFFSKKKKEKTKKLKNL